MVCTLLLKLRVQYVVKVVIFSFNISSILGYDIPNNRTASSRKKPVRNCRIH